MKNPFRFPRRSRASIERAIDAELQFHLDQRVADLVKGGLSERDAKHSALAEFGDIDFTRRYCQGEDMNAEREVRRRDYLDELRGNVAYAFRSLKRSPGYTAVALLTLALAIGANTAIFSVVNAVMLAPLPYANPGQLVSVFENNTKTHYARSDMSAADLRDYRELQNSLSGLAWVSTRGATLRDGEGDAFALRASSVSANLFGVLGVPAAYGRVFTADEDAPGRTNVTILPWSTWKRLFGSDTTVVGRVVSVNNTPVTIVGIMPRDFAIGYREELYLPLDLTAPLADVNRARKFHFLYAMGRLKPGETAESAGRDFNAIAQSLEAKYRDANDGHYVTVMPMQVALSGDMRRTSLLVMAGAICVLLVAAANLTNMGLARAVARRREMAVRAAIGASRGHLVRQLVAESLVIALLGGAAGVGVGIVGSKLLLALNPTILPPLAQVTFDWRVLAFTLGVSIVTGVAVGVLPALGASKSDPGSTLSSSRGAVGHARGSRVRRGLVVAQVALAVVLLVGAGLLTRSLNAVRNVSLGFEPLHAAVATVPLGGPRYQGRAALNQAYDALLEKLRTSPGVTAVGAAAGIPFIGTSGCGFAVDGPEVKGRPPFVLCGAIRGDYMKAVGGTIVKGRDFDASDLPDGPKVLIVNEAAARAIWPNEDPIGQRVRLGPSPSSPWETVVGVMRDVKQDDLERAAEPMMYENDVQQGWGALGIVVRMAGDAAQAEPLIRSALKEFDPSLAVRQVMPLTQAIGTRLASRRFVLGLVGSFAGLAFILAVVGIYGVLAYLVTARTREFGIRIALGASTESVWAGVLRQGLAWTGAGLLVGALGGFFVARALPKLLYGVTAADPVTFVAVGVTFAVVASLACIIPARRATRVEPVIALRTE